MELKSQETVSKEPRRRPIVSVITESRLFKALQPVVAAVLVLGAWHFIVVAFDVPKYIFPTPGNVIEEGIKYFPEMPRHYLVTLKEALVGYAIAVTIAVPSAVIIALSGRAQRLLYPTMALADMIPKAALAPLYIVWLGIGVKTQFAITAQVAFFPIVLNGILGFRSIDPELVYLAESTGATPWKFFWKIRLPNALPTLFVGLKYGAALSMVGAVIGEFIGGRAGLGYYLAWVMAKFKTPLGLAVMMLLTTIGVGLFFSVHLVERLAIPWHVARRAVGDTTS